MKCLFNVIKTCYLSVKYDNTCKVIQLFLKQDKWKTICFIRLVVYTKIEECLYQIKLSIKINHQIRGLLNRLTKFKIKFYVYNIFQFEYLRFADIEPNYVISCFSKNIPRCFHPDNIFSFSSRVYACMFISPNLF